MNDITRSSQFIANIRKVYDIYVFQTCQFLMFFLSTCNLFSSERSNPIPRVSKINMSADIMS